MPELKLNILNRKSSYLWYLSTTFWQERRDRAIKAANGICEHCFKKPATQVHHLTYIRIYNELPSDLMALCAECHKSIHHAQPANDNQLSFDLFGT